MAPRMFQRRASLFLLGGYREATQVGFYGIGTDTLKDDRANYAFDLWYGSAMMTVRPTRRYLTLRGGLELSEWNQKPGEGSAPSVDAIYDPATLPGLNSRITYLHSQVPSASTGVLPPTTRAAAAFMASAIRSASGGLRSVNVPSAAMTASTTAVIAMPRRLKPVAAVTRFPLRVGRKPRGL